MKDIIFLINACAGCIVVMALTLVAIALLVDKFATTIKATFFFLCWYGVAIATRSMNTKRYRQIAAECLRLCDDIDSRHGDK